MKRRWLACLLAVSMVLALGACGNKENNADAGSTESSVESSVEESGTVPSVEETVDSTVENEAESPAQDAQDAQDVETIGTIIKNDFQTIVAENEGLTAEEIAAKICENESLVINPVAMKVDPGLLSGFDNFEVKGFRDGAIFAPMIGSIPFVGYVFVMEEGTDIDAFMNDLKENANLSWNICVTAEDMVIDRADDKILFVMCPLSFES